LFLIGQFKKIFSETAWPNEPNLYRGPSIDASYQVSVHLAKRFRRRFFKLANQKQELPVAAMFVNRSGQNDQSLEDLP
jgi:hypothetical protein